MTIYAGETLVITHTAQVDGVDLTNAEVDYVTIEIFDSAGDVIEDGEMVWDAGQDRWEYVWVTNDGAATPTELESGTYRAKVTVVGLSGTENWEYKRIRLARNPV